VWLDHKERVKKDGIQTQERVTQSTHHLLQLINQHKGNVSDIVGQIRSLNKSIETSLAELRDISKHALDMLNALMHHQEELNPTDAEDTVHSSRFSAFFQGICREYSGLLAFVGA
jgi:hypothetical protein